MHAIIKVILYTHQNPLKSLSNLQLWLYNGSVIVVESYILAITGVLHMCAVDHTLHGSTTELLVCLYNYILCTEFSRNINFVVFASKSIVLYAKELHCCGCQIRLKKHTYVAYQF